jgi:hypothetical protein
MHIHKQQLAAAEWSRVQQGFIEFQLNIEQISSHISTSIRFHMFFSQFYHKYNINMVYIL